MKPLACPVYSSWEIASYENGMRKFAQVLRQWLLTVLQASNPNETHCTKSWPKKKIVLINPKIKKSASKSKCTNVKRTNNGKKKLKC